MVREYSSIEEFFEDNLTLKRYFEWLDECCEERKKPVRAKELAEWVNSSYDYELDEVNTYRALRSLRDLGLVRIFKKGMAQWQVWTFAPVGFGSKEEV